jgi:pimeloyl-ACP methyl ester carboxylesterase
MAAALAPLVALATGAARAQAPAKIGVVMLHGKNPGSANDPNFRPHISRLEREGMLVVLPDMPWSQRRYLEGDWDGAMQELGRHVAALRDKGATRIVLMGHSMGCPAALSYAARHQDVHGLVLFAPGHIPNGYYTYPALSAVRKSIDEARELVAAGKGGEKGRFADINQGRVLSVSMPARDYLSYFDPASDADMGVTAPRVPAGVPVLTVLGDSDPLFRIARSYFHDKLPAHPKTTFLEVGANHVTTPTVAMEQAVAWIQEAVAR